MAEVAVDEIVIEAAIVLMTDAVVSQGAASAVELVVTQEVKEDGKTVLVIGPDALTPFGTSSKESGHLV